MSYEEAVFSIEIGIEETNKLIDAGYRVIGVGEMGNETVTINLNKTIQICIEV